MTPVLEPTCQKTSRAKLPATTPAGGGNDPLAFIATTCALNGVVSLSNGTGVHELGVTPLVPGCSNDGLTSTCVTTADAGDAIVSNNTDGANRPSANPKNTRRSRERCMRGNVGNEGAAGANHT